jgi:DNA modification methylase
MKTRTAGDACLRGRRRWILGDHKLFVGDATNSDDVARLMAEAAADLLFSDPPYKVDYEGYTDDRLKIRGDRKSDGAFKKFLEAAFRSCRAALKPGASLYVCHSSSWQREFQNALEAAGFDIVIAAYLSCCNSLGDSTIARARL